MSLSRQPSGGLPPPAPAASQAEGSQAPATLPMEQLPAAYEELRRMMGELLAAHTRERSRGDQLAQALTDQATVISTLRANPTPSHSEASTSGRLPPGCKPNPPRAFAGDKDTDSLGSWLFTMNTYLTLMGVVEDRKQILLAGTYLTGPALTWYRAVCSEEAAAGARVTSWAVFQQELKLNFCPTNTVKLARDRFSRLYQREGLRDYIREFRTITLDIPSMAEDEKLDKFVRGLRSSLRTEVAIREPDSLDKAIKLAENLDAVLRGTGSVFRDAYRSRDFGSRPDSRRNSPSPMELGYAEYDPPTAPKKPQSQPQPLQRSTSAPVERLNYMDGPRRPNNNNSGGWRIANMSDGKKARLMREGRCLICEAHGHLARECPKRAGQGNGSRGRSPSPRDRSPSPTASHA